MGITRLPRSYGLLRLLPRPVFCRQVTGNPVRRSNPRLRLKARKQGVGAREFLRFATL
jgi:hypothetical protein